MNMKYTAPMVLGCVMAVGVSAAHAGNQFSALSGIDATPLNPKQMAEVEGMAHDTFPLGAMLLKNTNGRVASTPAWDKGLNPSGALGKAQVGKSRGNN